MEQNLIDQLIATYRELNLTLRPMSDEELRRPMASGRSIRDVVAELRDSELRFSQALKDRQAGTPMPPFEEIISSGEALVVGSEGQDDSTEVLLSQFGTAREATLTMVRFVSTDEVGSIQMEDPSVRQEIVDRITQLVMHDHRLLAEIGIGDRAATA